MPVGSEKKNHIHKGHHHSLSPTIVARGHCVVLIYVHFVSNAWQVISTRTHALPMLAMPSVDDITELLGLLGV